MERNEALARMDNIVGPMIGGTVTVQLSELDKLRADHVAAIRAYKELAEHVKEVRVVLVSGDGSQNKIVKEKNLKESSISYKNLEDFRNLIAAEEREKLQNQFEALNKQLEEESAKNLKHVEYIQSLKVEWGKERSEWKKERADWKEQVLGRDNLLEETQKTMEEANKTISGQIETIAQLEKERDTYRDGYQTLSGSIQRQRPWYKFW